MLYNTLSVLNNQALFNIVNFFLVGLKYHVFNHFSRFRIYRMRNILKRTVIGCATS